MNMVALTRKGGYSNTTGLLTWSHLQTKVGIPTQRFYKNIKIDKYAH